MKKTRPLYALTYLLLVFMLLAVSACGGQPSEAQLQTAVAETLAAAPTQPDTEIQVVEVTQVKEVTQVVRITSTPEPTIEVSPSATPEPTATVTETATPEPLAGLVKTATSTPAAVEATGPLGMSLTTMFNRYDDMTDLQKEEFIETLPGKTVRWIAEVYNITTDGTLILDNPYGPGRVRLLDVPIDQSMTINKDMLVDFTGTIAGFEATRGRYVIVIDATVTRAYYEPTATPTKRW